MITNHRAEQVRRCEEECRRGEEKDGGSRSEQRCLDTKKVILPGEVSQRITTHHFICTNLETHI